MNRRRFLRSASFALAGTRALAATPPVAGPILDSHIHLFDPTRPGGIPWPLPGDSIYKPALPARYEALTKPLGVVGAIAIEASPLAADNDWLLSTIASHPVIVGMVGDLIPTAPGFSRELDRLHRNPLFLGIRHGNLWDRSLSADLGNPALSDALHALIASGLVFESANPDLPLLEALARVAHDFPDLTVVVDHLPHMAEPDTAPGRDRFNALLHELGQAPRVFAKLSEIPSPPNGQPDLDLAPYRDRLDRLWDTFGPSRLIFGSDWPNGDHVASYADTLQLTRQYLAGKATADTRRILFSNSQAAYRWKPRRPDQHP